MIKTNKSKVPRPISPVVPGSWILAYMVFKGIAEDTIQEAEREWKDSDEYVYAWPPKNDSFFDAFHAMYEDLCVRVSLTSPSWLVEEASKGEAVDDLLRIARKIVDVFEPNEEKILHYGNPPSGSLYDIEAYRIYDNCKYVVSILDYEDPPEDDDIRQELHYFFFSDRFLKPLYDKVFMLFPESDPSVTDKDVGKLTSYRDFRAVVNLLETIGVSEWEEEDVSGIVLRPFGGYGMVMYALTVLLFGKRNLECRDNPVIFYRKTGNGPVEVDFDDFGCAKGDFMEPDKEYWISTFLKRLDWSDGYTVVDDLWKRAFRIQDRYEEALSSNPVSQSESDILAKFVHRNVFAGVCAAENVVSIVSFTPYEPSAEDYFLIHEEFPPKDLNAQKGIRNLYHLLCSETAYMYQNTDYLSGVFMTENDAEYVRWKAEEHSEQEGKYNRALRQMLSYDEPDLPDMTVVYERLMEGHEYRDIPLIDQPCVTSTMMRQYILNCIIQDERLKLVLLQKMNEMSYLKTIHTIDMEELRKQKILERLESKGYIDSNKVIQGGKKREMLRFLVEEEIAVPKNGWPEGIEEAKTRLDSPLTDEKTGNLDPALLMSDDNFRQVFHAFNYVIHWEFFSDTFKEVDSKGGPLKSLVGKDLRNTFNTNPGYGSHLEIGILRAIVRKYEQKYKKEE